MRHRAVFLFSLLLCLASVIGLASFAATALNALTRYALPIAACVWLTYVIVAMAMPRRRTA